MSAVGIYRAVRVSWTNPSDRDLDHTEVFASTTNDRSLATIVGIPKSTPGVSQTWLHTNLTPLSVWFYWVRCIDTSDNTSTWFPVSPTAGWSATVTAIPVADLPPGLFATVYVTTTTQAMAVQTRYVVDVATLCTLTLPATALRGDAIKVDGVGVGLWKIAQNANQKIHVRNRVTTTGTGGSLAARFAHDAITLECIVPGASAEWEAV